MLVQPGLKTGPRQPPRQVPQFTDPPNDLLRRGNCGSAFHCFLRTNPMSAVRFFHEGNDLLSFHGGKPVEKLVNRIARLQIVEQRLNGHARTGKTGRAAHHVAVNVDDSSLPHDRIVRQTDREAKAGCGSVVHSSAPTRLYPCWEELDKIGK